MTWRPVDVVDGAYSDETKPWTCQDTVNWMVQPAEQAGTLSAAILRSVPGLKPYATTQNKPVRGAHDAEGLFLIVVGRTLYRVNTNGTTTALGTIPGVGRVSMDHNQIEAGNEVVIVNGQSGYVYNTRTSSLSTITDEAFPGSYIVDFIDGFIIGVDPAGRFWFISDLTQATQYSTLDRMTAESKPDKIVTALVVGDMVLVWGVGSLEFFQNTGQATSTFVRVRGMTKDVGCASKYARARLDNTAYWLGDDGSVYMLSGGSPSRISTGAMEKAIAKLNWENAFAFTQEDQGHKIFYLTFPDGHTWGYDVLSGKWFRRESFGLKRWRINTLTKWRRHWYAGDFSNGKLYRLDDDELTEDGKPLISRRRTPIAHSDGDPITIDGLKLIFDVGQAKVGVNDHFCSVRYSDDGGHNWSYAAIESLGAAGGYRQSVEIRQLGQADYRIWEIEVSSPQKRDLIGASWKAAGGRS